MSKHFIDADDIRAQREWSDRTFGPGQRTKGVLRHMREELTEVYHAPDDIEEWADLMILTLDGATRRGFTPEQIIDAYHKKMDTNMYDREWPDYRDFSEDEPINHVRTEAKVPEAYRVVRNMASTQTHVARVESTTLAHSFGVGYQRPDPKTKALCGVNIKDGVVMQEGTKTVCSACRHMVEQLTGDAA